MHLTLSIEDTNKIRDKLGLPLIPQTNEPLYSYNLKKCAIKLAAAQNLDHERDQRKEVSGTPERSLTIEAKEANGHETVVQDEYISTGSWLSLMNSKKPSVNMKGSTNELAKDNTIETGLEDRLKDVKDTDDLLNTADGSQEALTLNDASESSRDSGNTEAAISNEISALHEEVHSNGSVGTKEYNRQMQTGKHGQLSSKIQKAVFVPRKAKLKTKSSRSREVRALSIEPDLNNLLAQSRKKVVLGKIAAASFVENESNNETFVFGNAESSTKQGLQFDLLASLNKNSEDGPLGTVEKSPHQQFSEQPVETNTGNVEEESNTNLGIAATLKKLRSHKSQPAMNQSRQWAKRIAENYKLREQELKEFASKYANLPSHERDQIIDLQKQKLIRENAMEANKIIKKYQPTVTVDRCDDKGNEISSKQAFKQLSKAFHGVQKNH